MKINYFFISNVFLLGTRCLTGSFKFLNLTCISFKIGPGSTSKSNCDARKILLVGPPLKMSNLQVSTEKVFSDGDENSLLVSNSPTSLYTVETSRV